MHQNRQFTYLRKFGTRSNQVLARSTAGMLGHIYVCEFPRSGGTWLSYMLSDYFDMPKPHQPYFPAVKRSVIQNHWGYTNGIKQAVYMHRDGRDVCISQYHFCLRGLQQKNDAVRDYYRKRMPDFLASNWDAENCAEHLPQFIEQWALSPIGCRIPWGAHIGQWTGQQQAAVYTSYEALRMAPFAELKRLITALDRPNHKINEQKLHSIIENHSFEKLSGRKAGEAKTNEFMRKGIVGDWKNYFNKEAAEIFSHHFGAELIRLGYENDDSWLAGLDH